MDKNAKKSCSLCNINGVCKCSYCAKKFCNNHKFATFHCYNLDDNLICEDCYDKFGGYCAKCRTEKL